MTKKAYHHGNLREAILQSARDILDLHGVEGLSLRKVAQHTGVSATALYSHFRDKRELLAVLAAGGFEQLTADMQQQAANDGAAPDLAGLARGYVLFAVDNRALFQLMFGREIGDLLEFPQLVAAGSKSYELMATCVASAMGEATTAAKASVAATAAWSMVHGLSMLIIDGRITAQDQGVNSNSELVNQVCSMLNFKI